MRHGKKFNHLGRTKSHRAAMLSNMASSLFTKKRIKTTLAKAKALRQYAEPLITKTKTDTTHSRRVVFSYLQDKEALKELFGVISEKVSERNGGYTRIIKLGARYGDNAEMAMIELVDFNENLSKDSSSEEAGEGKAKRSRRRGGKKTVSAKAETGAEEVVEVASEEAETEATEVADAEESEKKEENQDSETKSSEEKA